jgi:hypothetical protein
MVHRSGNWLAESESALMECPWCELEYDLNAETERAHLAICKVFQSLPIVETSPSGKTFVEYAPGILVERVRIV